MGDPGAIRRTRVTGRASGFPLERDRPRPACSNSLRVIMDGAMAEKTLYLIDGHSLLYRSYYAIRNLSTSAGFPTNAIFGFISTLRKIKEEAKPSHLGIVFDAPGRKLRHDVFEAYKAQRKPMPEDLAAQIPKLREVIQALRIPVIVFEKYEADDVLAQPRPPGGAEGIQDRRRHDGQGPPPDRGRDRERLQSGQGHPPGPGQSQGDVRRPARAGHRPPLPLGRPFGQCSRRSGDRREDRPES